jgi:penicillin-binding protein 1A
MNVAHRGYCEDFPQPKTPFVSSPFFGKYAKEGAPGDSTVPYNNYLYNGGTQPQTDKKKKGGNNSYDPRLYEAPPQPAPQTQAPAPAPTTPGNNGNGNGQGNGNAPTGTDGGGAAPPGTTVQTQG